MKIFDNIKQTVLNIRGGFILSLACIAVGLSISKALMFSGFSLLIILWFVDGNIKQKINHFFSNKIALILSSIYFISLFGLIYTENFDFAFADLRRKGPLFVIPFCFSGFNPLSKKELHFLLKVYIVGVVVATLWSLFVYLGGLNISIVDKRALSRFNSHIRFGLEIALAIFFSFYYYKRSNSSRLKLLWGSIILWLILSLYLFSLFSGTVIFLISLSILLATGLFTENKTKKRVSFSLFCFLAVTSFLFIGSAVNSFYKDKKVESIKEIVFTENGEKYFKNKGTENSSIKENGYFVEKNIAWIEFGGAWNQISNIDIDGKDSKGNILRNTLIRFITSKGQRKDKEAIESLTLAEIKAIENGVANYKYMEMNPLHIRLHKIIWEYDSYVNGGNVNGHSVLMRWEFWKTGVNIIKHNLLFGVGTGDVQDAFNAQYKKDQSQLLPQYRLRAHNQYLTYLITFGVCGFILFLFCLIYPIVKAKLYKNYFYITFISVICLSMLTEDTLENHIGINLFVFFNSLFLLSLNYKQNA